MVETLSGAKTPEEMEELGVTDEMYQKVTKGFVARRSFSIEGKEERRLTSKGTWSSGVVSIRISVCVLSDPYRPYCGDAQVDECL